MKIIGVLSNKNYREFLNACPFVDAWIINIEGFSYSHFNNFSTDSLDELFKFQDYKYIINLEKIYSENELEKVQNLIKKFKKYNNVYFSYSDFGTLELLKDEEVNRTIYHASTMVTNLRDAEIAVEENHLLILGKEISYEEICYIDQKISKKIGIDAFGKFPIFYSKRHLLTTYFNYRKYEKSPNELDYSLVEEFRDDEYPITESDETLVYEPFFYILGSELKAFKNIEWIVIHSEFLSDEIYLKILKEYYEYVNNNFNCLNKQQLEDNISNYVSTYKGKLSEKTILRKGEK